MRDIEKVRANVAKLASKGMDQSKIDKYVAMEGYDPNKLYDGEAPKSEGEDPAIERQMKMPSKMDLLKSAVPVVGATEALTGGASEDLLPLGGQLLAGGAAGFATKNPALTMAAGAAGAGYGEIARQGIRKLRGKDTSNFSKDVATETGLGLASEVGGRVLEKGARFVAKTPLGHATLNAFARAMAKATTLTEKGQKAVWDVMNFMGDLHPKSVDYAVRRGPGVLFRPDNYDEKIMGTVAKDVVERLEQTRTGATKAFEHTLKEFYKSEYLKKYPFIKKILPSGLDKIKREIRFYPYRVVQAGEAAMKEFGYTNRLGSLKPTVLGNIGNKLDEGERLNKIIDKVRSFKHMTPDDALTLREEINGIIYDGWKNPKTRVAIGEATGSAKSVLKSINKELSARLHTRIPGLKPMDETYQQVQDIVRRAKPQYGNTDAAEKFMRKYHATTKGTDKLTTAEKELIDQVDQIIPHKQKVLDHLYAMEFKPIISNFWKSRAISGLVAGGAAGAGFLAGGPEGAAKAGALAMAATSPRLIAKGLKAGEKLSVGMGKVARGTGKVIKASTKPAIKASIVQSRRAQKNEREK